MTNAQKLARDCALDVLKAYNSKIFSSIATPEQRERAQAAAYASAESWARTMFRIAIESCPDWKEYLDRKASDES